jgi:hypothetical protein
MEIKKFQEFSLIDQISNDFINSLDSFIKESDQSYSNIQSKILVDLRLNTNLALTFGTGISTLYPFVDKLIRNMKIDSIDVTADKVVLLTICAFTIVYLEEKKFKDHKEEDLLTKDSKSMLEELKMMGIGNGIVKKLVKLFKSIVNIFSLIGKHIYAVVSGFIDMFAYTSLLIPILNGLLYVSGKYDLNIDTFLQNFSGIMMGVGTIITKHGIASILDKIKLKINKKKVLREIDTSIIKKISTYDSANDGEMINEQ